MAIYLTLLFVGFLTPFPSEQWGWVVVVALLFFAKGDFREALERPFLWLFVGLAWLSVFWSEAPRTLEAGLVLGADAWLGVCMARRFSFEQIARLVLIALALTLTLSLLVICFIPSAGIGPDGLWKGVLPHKNALGRSAGLALLILLLMPASSLRLPYRACLILLSGTILIESGSVTPLVAVGMCLLTVLQVKGLKNRTWRIPSLVLGMTFVTLIVFNWANCLDLVNRSPILHGRVKIWSGCARFAFENLWWGHGFSQVEASWFERTVNAHNGVLSLIVQLGLIGCTLFLLDLALVLLAAGRLLLARLDFERAAPIVYVLFFALLNLDEVTPPHGGHFSEWLLYVAASQKILMRDRELSELDACASP